jgi:hypothetical protein
MEFIELNFLSFFRILSNSRANPTFLLRQVFIGATDSALPCALLLDVAKSLGPLLYARSEKVSAFFLLFFGVIFFGVDKK